MQILVHRSRCDGNGVCMGIVPEVFDVDDDLVLHVLDPSPTEEEVQARVRQAVISCPTLALSVDET